MESAPTDKTKKGNDTMKKTIAKTAALVMAAMIAVPAAAAVYAPVPVYAVSKTAAKDSDTNMKAALTVAKKRITIPPELTEFEYYTDNSYGTTIYRFTWLTPNNAKEYKHLEAAVMGNIVISYNNYLLKPWNREPKFAKLTEEQLIEKAKGYAKQFNPDIYDKMKFELDSLSLTSGTAEVRFGRYENGISVPSNGGIIELDKNTGELMSFQCDWWENADFSDPKGAKSEEEIKAAYKSLCKLTPYYKISSEYDEKTKKYKNVARLVYDPDMTSEIDAYTAEPSSIWDDMNSADGTRYYGYYNIENPATGITEDCAEADAGEGGVEFSPAELEKIEKDNNLVKPAELFEKFKKDPYVALNDNYKLDSYNIYSEKDEKDKESFYMYLTYKFDKTKKSDNYYETISVRVNAETGEVLALNKWGLTSADGLPKLDVTKANTIANNAAKTYSKDIISQYKANENNKRPVELWEENVNGKWVKEYENCRNFTFNRYVNDIRVQGDTISVSVDSLGTVTSYSVSHTENVKFPKADILTADEAFEKLYKQQDFKYYYNGWIGKDGKIHTYLLYKMDEFYLNAKTGALCNWSGDKPYSYVYARDVKYTDIKGIPQEEAILALQKYGIAVTKEKKFDPTAVITEDEFASLLSSALMSEVPVEVEEVEYEGETDAEAKARIEAEKKDRAETTREEAAVIFAKMYDPNGLGELKGIYKSPFGDVKSTDENAGYIAIAYAKGFISKPADGKLNGGHKITRAEAVQMLYDYLKLISK